MGSETATLGFGCAEEVACVASVALGISCAERVGPFGSVASVAPSISGAERVGPIGSVASVALGISGAGGWQGQGDQSWHWSVLSARNANLVVKSNCSTNKRPGPGNGCRLLSAFCF